MAKSADAFRTISEVADDLQVAKHVLRFWEMKFPQIRPMKRGGGRRYYRPEDIELLRGIRQLLQGDGYTIKGVQRIFKEQGSESIKAVGRDQTAASLASPPRERRRKGLVGSPRVTSARPRAARRIRGGATAAAASDTKSPRSPVVRKVIAELEACRLLLTEESRGGEATKRTGGKRQGAPARQRATGGR